jgi:phenylpropionate dioxygenase-like ring-hydroxylating dioxygenase large terminal subunit
MVDQKQLVDNQRGLLDRSIYTREEIYQQELEHVFGRMWLFIGHDSQIPNPNDFSLTYMGEDPVILTRDAKGEVHAFLNMCMHRGNRVARADDGNAKNFMCTYHGWTYSNEGKLVSVPGLQEAYYGELDVDKLGLVSVAQIDTYAGLIFATWDAQAPSLEDYLGDARWYLDNAFNRREGGIELIGPEKWVGQFNWKFPADNFSGDNYHVHINHRSAFMARFGSGNVPPLDVVYNPDHGYSVSPGQGHGIATRLYDTEEQFDIAFNQLGDSKILIDYERSIRPEMTKRLGERNATRQQGIVGTIFPNLSWLWPQVNGTVRIWHPRGPLHTEVWSYVAIDKAAPQEVKDAQRRFSMVSFGNSGIFEQDDMDNWRQCTESGFSQVGRRVPQNITMGLGHETTHDYLPGPLLKHDITESSQRGFYAWWEEALRAKSWSDLKVTPKTAKYEGTATFKG